MIYKSSRVCFTTSVWNNLRCLYFIRHARGAKEASENFQWKKSREREAETLKWAEEKALISLTGSSSEFCAKLFGELRYFIIRPIVSIFVQHQLISNWMGGTPIQNWIKSRRSFPFTSPNDQVHVDSLWYSSALEKIRQILFLELGKFKKAYCFLIPKFSTFIK